MSELRWGLLSGFLRVMKSRCVVAVLEIFAVVVAYKVDELLV